MTNKKSASISRREFAGHAVLASAAAALAPAGLLSGGTPPIELPAQLPPNFSKLSADSQAEVDSRIQSIFTQYGSRLSAAQKADIQRLSTLAQPPLDRLRAFRTENGDGPALYLKPLVEHEKKSSSIPAAMKPAKAAKKS
jgi:hypothetical protein